MIDILDDIQLPTIKLVDRLPRKKDSNTIYIKEMKNEYRKYIWLFGKWHIVEIIKKGEEE